MTNIIESTKKDSEKNHVKKIKIFRKKKNKRKKNGPRQISKSS